MALTVVGMDEAGYGPLLGPLCVGMSAVRVASWEPGERAPDLWKLLGSAVCRKGSDARRRIPVADSKKLKLPNDGKADPVTHLERGVLAFLGAMGVRPTTDSELLAELGADAGVDEAAWYGGEAVGVPRAGRTGGSGGAGGSAMTGVDANRLGLALREAGAEVMAVRCRVVGEGLFNELVRLAGTKAATTGWALAEHLRHAWDAWGRVDDGGRESGLRVVCDRQGGRAAYAGFLEKAMRMPKGKGGDGAKEMEAGSASVRVEVLEEGPVASRYEVRGTGADGAERMMVVRFQVEAEEAFLPVALASMTAKLVRETLMARLNRYWCARVPGLKATAGYTQDGRRWLRDVQAVMTKEERERMVRKA